jgi:hypothetical protein
LTKAEAIWDDEWLMSSCRHGTHHLADTTRPASDKNDLAGDSEQGISLKGAHCKRGRGPAEEKRNVAWMDQDGAFALTTYCHEIFFGILTNFTGSRHEWARQEPGKTDTN